MNTSCIRKSIAQSFSVDSFCGIRIEVLSLSQFAMTNRLAARLYMHCYQHFARFLPELPGPTSDMATNVLLALG